jgi:hypothetical protein
MKNKYKVEGDTVCIFLNRDLSTMIDLSDLEKVDSHPGTWGAYPGGNGSFYVQTKIPGTSKHMKLARFIMDAKDDDIVDHHSRDTLNNTRTNLRKVTVAENRYNSKLSRNNTSGHAGVVWAPKENRWKAQIWASGKNKFLGYFSDKDKAVHARIEAEKELRGV